MSVIICNILVVAPNYMEMKCTNAYKNVQRRYYDVLSYKYSSVFITLFTLLLFLTLLNFGEVSKYLPYLPTTPVGPVASAVILRQVLLIYD